MSHRLRAGFLFESLLSFKEKKKTLYLLHSPLRTFNVPVNDVIVLKKKPTNCLKWLYVIIIFCHVLVLKCFKLFGKNGVTLSTEISNSQIRNKIFLSGGILVKIQG